MNFKNEILELVREYKKSLEDIEFIVWGDSSKMRPDILRTPINWAKLDFEFSEAFRADSLIKFKDGSWLERDEVAGSFIWKYRKIPQFGDYHTVCSHANITNGWCPNCGERIYAREVRECKKCAQYSDGVCLKKSIPIEGSTRVWYSAYNDTCFEE